MWPSVVFVVSQLRVDARAWIMPMGLIALYSALLQMMSAVDNRLVVHQGIWWIGLGLVFKTTWGSMVGGVLSLALCEALKGYPYKIFRLSLARLYVLTGVYTLLVGGCVWMTGDLQYLGYHLPVFVFYILAIQGVTELLLLRARAGQVSAYLLLFPLELPLYIFVFEYNKLSLDQLLKLAVGFVGLGHLLLLISIFLLFRWEKSCNSEILSLH